MYESNPGIPSLAWRSVSVPTEDDDSSRKPPGSLTPKNLLGLAVCTSPGDRELGVEGKGRNGSWG